jgi:hypothetical protein
MGEDPLSKPDTPTLFRPPTFRRRVLAFAAPHLAAFALRQRFHPDLDHDSNSTRDRVSRPRAPKDSTMRHPFSDVSKNYAPSDDDLFERIDRLLRDANKAAALPHKLKLIDIEGAHRLAAYHSHFNPNQPRVPKGHHDGGQWTRVGGGLQRLAALDAAQAPDRLIMSDAAPDGIRVWTQYAELKDRDAVQDDTDVGSAADAAFIERTTEFLHKIVLAVATAVIRRPGSTPREFGTAVHTEFARVVRGLNLPGIGRDGVEQSFDQYGLAHYGKDGSIRTDVVLRNNRGIIIAIFDLKTGDAIIRPPRAAEIRAMTKAGPNVPVIELHAARGPVRR